MYGAGIICRPQVSANSQRSSRPKSWSGERTPIWSQPPLSMALHAESENSFRGPELVRFASNRENSSAATTALSSAITLTLVLDFFSSIALPPKA